jgi:hypothetical protein
MLNLIRKLNAVLYLYRVSHNLSSADNGLLDAVRFPSYLPFMRKARIHGFPAKKCASLFQTIARNAERSGMNKAAQDIAIDAAMKDVTGNDELWK